MKLKITRLKDIMGVIIVSVKVISMFNLNKISEFIKNSFYILRKCHRIELESPVFKPGFNTDDLVGIYSLCSGSNVMIAKELNKKEERKKEDQNF